MKKITYFVVMAAMLGLGFQVSRAADAKKADAKPAAKAETKKSDAKKDDAKPAAGKKSAADLEKEKALANPYPNDLGPAEIDDIVKGYSEGSKKGYELLKVRCAKCHTPSRPLNSRFVEVLGKDDAEKKAAVAKLQKEHPEQFGAKAEGIWQIEDSVWKRYVKRMAAKPGCDIAGADAKQIWEFLVQDSQRKIGANAEKWKAHREGLLKQFKEKYPKRYDELKEQKDL